MSAAEMGEKSMPPPSLAAQADTSGTALSLAGDPEELLTVAEAARILKVKPSTLRQWVREGRCPSYKLGPRATRFTRPLLRRFRDENLSMNGAS